MIENIALTFAETLLNEINKIMNETKTGEQKMAYSNCQFNYKELSTEEQIKAFYEILESADRDYRYEIDNEYMNIMLTEFWKLRHTEELFYDLEYLQQRIDQDADDHEYSAEELECFYEILSSFRYDLLKKYNIEMPLFY